MLRPLRRTSFGEGFLSLHQHLPPEGTRQPSVKLPDGATDTHFHVFGPHAAYAVCTNVDHLPAETLPSTIDRLFAQIGIQRGVLIQPTTYGHDNSRHLSAAAEMDIEARVIVAAPANITEPELEEMHRQGARGVRFVINPAMNKNATSWPDMERIAAKVAPLGWHAQILLAPDQLLDLSAAIAKLPCEVVLDHFALIDPSTPTGVEATPVLFGMLETGRCWTKISGLYRGTSDIGATRDVSKPVAAMLEAVPDRLLWGSDWPHASYGGPMPTLADVIDPLLDLVSDDRLRRLILVDNPAKLYGFGSNAEGQA